MYSGPFESVYGVLGPFLYRRTGSILKYTAVCRLPPWIRYILLDMRDCCGVRIIHRKSITSLLLFSGTVSHLMRPGMGLLGPWLCPVWVCQICTFLSYLYIKTYSSNKLAPISCRLVSWDEKQTLTHEYLICLFNNIGNWWPDLAFYLDKDIYVLLCLKFLKNKPEILFQYSMILFVFLCEKNTPNCTLPTLLSYIFHTLKWHLQFVK